MPTPPFVHGLALPTHLFGRRLPSVQGRDERHCKLVGQPGLHHPV